MFKFGYTKTSNTLHKMTEFALYKAEKTGEKWNLSNAILVKLKAKKKRF